MNYKKHYDVLIERAKYRELDGYAERHHIIPRCLGGTDEQDNLVTLTAREHYVAHQLLTKIYPGNRKLVYAAAMMCVASKSHSRMTNRLYEWLKKKHSQVVSENQSGEGNSQHGTMWIYNVELRKCKKIGKTEPIPKNWNKGRVLDFDNYYVNKIKRDNRKPRHIITEEENRVREEQKRLREEKKEQVLNESIEYAYDLFDRYKTSGCSSIREFCKTDNYDKSHVALTKMWKKYVPEYDDLVKHGRRFVIK